LDTGFAAKVAPGDILVAGSNFGCGSSREHAPISIKAVGVACVIARSFARIFFRNAINIGLPIVECPQAAEGIQSGDVVSVDVNTGIIKNLTKNETYQAQPFPAFMQELIGEGGLMNYVKKQLQTEEV
jgi:3-isopropylmalate dehydratase small subunit